MNQHLLAAVAAFSIFAALTVTSNPNPNPPVEASKRASDDVQHRQATYPLDRKPNALQRDSRALGCKAARLAVLSGFEVASLEAEDSKPGFEIESQQSDPWILMSDVERLESVVLEPED